MKVTVELDESTFDFIEWAGASLGAERDEKITKWILCALSNAMILAASASSTERHGKTKELEQARKDILNRFRGAK